MRGPIRSGEFRWKIRFERLANGQNALNEETGAWAEVITVPTLVLSGTGQERREAAQESAITPATFRVRRSPETAAITEEDRARFTFFGPVTDQSPIWNISSVVPFGGDAIDITAVRKR